MWCELNAQGCFSLVRSIHESTWRQSNICRRVRRVKARRVKVRRVKARIRILLPWRQGWRIDFLSIFARLESPLALAPGLEDWWCVQPPTLCEGRYRLRIFLDIGFALSELHSTWQQNVDDPYRRSVISLKKEQNSLTMETQKASFKQNQRKH